MTRHVGRLTLAASLIMMGVVFLVGNVTSQHAAWYVARAWPLMLVVLGLEWLWTVQQAGPGATLRLDVGSVVGLVVIALVAANVGAAYRAPFRIAVPMPNVQIQVPAVAAAPAFPFGGNSAKTARSIPYDTPVPGLAEVDLTDSSASVDVIHGDSFTIELTVIATGSSDGQAQDLANQVRLNVVPGRVTNVSATRPGISNLGLAYRVTVPDGVSVRVTTSSGSVTARGVDGNLTVQTSSGSINAADVTGTVVASSSSGAIFVTDVKGAVRTNATSGSIRIEGAAAAVSAQTSSGSVTVQTDDVGGDYDLGAMSGSVRLTIPASAGVKVSARASSGNVSGPQWLTLGEGRNSGTGTQGTGEHQVTIRTSSGSIQIDAH